MAASATVIGGGTERLPAALTMCATPDSASPDTGAGIFCINTFLDPFPIPHHDMQSAPLLIDNATREASSSRPAPPSK
jgi:hypothetical protein